MVITKREIDLSYFNNKVIAITGGTGYIGSKVIQKLRQIPCTIITVDKKRAVWGKNSHAKIFFIEADIKDKSIWLDLLKRVNILFHFAAQTSSKFANDNPIQDLEINLLPVVNIIETCLRKNLSPDIIFSGTVTQTGFTNTYPVNEERLDFPITVYDINKLAAEKYLQYYTNQLKRRAVILRLSNVYGPGPKSSSLDRGILNQMVTRALHQKDLTIFGDGHFVRDYIYIDDVAEAFLFAAKFLEKVKGNYFVIGSGKGYTINEMANIVQEQVFKHTGRKIEIKHIPIPSGTSEIELRSFIADTKKFKEATGWQARIGLKKGIYYTIDYFLKGSVGEDFNTGRSRIPGQ